MGTRIDGYNVAFKVGTKDFVAATSHKFDLTMTEKESITKDDNGTKKTRIIGHTYTFSVDGVAEINSVGETTKIDRDGAIALTLAKQPVTFIYSASGAKSYTGQVVIINYSETSGAEDELSYSLNMKSVSNLTEVPEE